MVDDIEGYRLKLVRGLSLTKTEEDEALRPTIIIS